MRILAWPTKTPWNPYTSLVYANLGAQTVTDPWPGNLLREYSIWHVHWPDSLLNIRNTAHAAFKLSGFFRRHGLHARPRTKLIWTMHNFASHEAYHPKLESGSAPVHSPCRRRHQSQRRGPVDRAKALSPSPRYSHHRDSSRHYRDQYPLAAGDARARLGIPVNAKVLMFFGAVRAYKNVDSLVQAFRKMPDPNALLYIVGKPNSDPLANFITRKPPKTRASS